MMKIKCYHCKRELVIISYSNDKTEIYIKPCRECAKKMRDFAEKQGENYARQEISNNIHGQVMGM